MICLFETIVLFFLSVCLGRWFCWESPDLVNERYRYLRTGNILGCLILRDTEDVSMLRLDWPDYWCSLHGWFVFDCELIWNGTIIYPHINEVQLKCFFSISSFDIICKTQSTWTFCYEFVERLSMKRLMIRPVLADVPGATRLSCTVGSCASHRSPMRSTENPQPVVGCGGWWWGLVNTVSHQCSFWWVLWYVVVAFKHSLSTLWYPKNMVCRKVRYYGNTCLLTFLLWLHWGPMGLGTTLKYTSVGGWKIAFRQIQQLWFSKVTTGSDVFSLFKL